MRVYLVGGLRDGEFDETAKALRKAGYDVVDDWRGASPSGDVNWRAYEYGTLGVGYAKAVWKPFAEQVRNFDCCLLETCKAAIAVCAPFKLPGRSSVAELAFAREHKLRTFVLLNGEPAEWDAMLPLVADHFCRDISELLWVLENRWPEVEEMGPEELYADTLNPVYYRSRVTGLEAIDVIEAFAADNYLRASAIKYLLRAGKKVGASSDHDLLKAKWFIDREIANLHGLTSGPQSVGVARKADRTFIPVGEGDV